MRNLAALPRKMAFPTQVVRILEPLIRSSRVCIFAKPSRMVFRPEIRLIRLTSTPGAVTRIANANQLPMGNAWVLVNLDGWTKPIDSQLPQERTGPCGDKLTSKPGDENRSVKFFKQRL